jgi:hypothetical protein
MQQWGVPFQLEVRVPRTQELQFAALLSIVTPKKVLSACDSWLHAVNCALVLHTGGGLQGEPLPQMAGLATV